MGQVPFLRQALQPGLAPISAAKFLRRKWTRFILYARSLGAIWHFGREKSQISDDRCVGKYTIKRCDVLEPCEPP
jgi:hypothetical protein